LYEHGGGLDAVRQAAAAVELDGAQQTLSAGVLLQLLYLGLVALCTRSWLGPVASREAALSLQVRTSRASRQRGGGFRMLFGRQRRWQLCLAVRRRLRLFRGGGSNRRAEDARSKAEAEDGADGRLGSYTVRVRSRLDRRRP
jgi:hypothetical protein